mgnify:CR=1 FL=1
MTEFFQELAGDWIPQLKIIAQVALALALGGIIGLEREIAHKPAGFRTHMLVAAAAATLMGLGNMMLEIYSAPEVSDIVRFDPIRIIQSIVLGISFLGAGTIFKHGDMDQIAGLTTAATILFAGVIGITVGLNQIVLAIGVTFLVLIVVHSLSKMEAWTNKKKRK